MKRKICPNCGYWKEIQRGVTYCEDCRKKLLIKYTKKEELKVGGKNKN